MIQTTIHFLFLVRLGLWLADEQVRRVPASGHVEEIVKVEDAAFAA